MKPVCKLALACAAVAVASLGQAQIFVFTANLDGPSEAPPNNSPGTGFTTVTMDTNLITMRVEVQFQDLIGPTTASHIHAPTPTPFTGVAGVATELPSFTGFPLGVTSGTYDHTFDMTDAGNWNPTFLTNNGGTPGAAFTAFLGYMNEGRTYLNIHTAQFVGGEIRGFLTPVPEPATFVALGLGAAALLRRRKRASN
jgi:hypothetical protein